MIYDDIRYILQLMISLYYESERPTA